MKTAPLRPGQLLAVGLGTIVALAIDRLGLLPWSPGSELGLAIRAALVYGLGGVGGGLVVHEVVVRLSRKE